MEAQGFITAGESAAALVYIKGRRGLSPRQMKLMLLLATLAVGVPLGAWVSGSWITAALCVEGALLGFGLGLAIIQALAA